METSFIVPAVIGTGMEKSWYPSGFRSSVWLPADMPGIVAGLAPRRTPSIRMVAPAGVVVMEREPSVSGREAVPTGCARTGGIVVPALAGEAAWAVVGEVTCVVTPGTGVVVGREVTVFTVTRFRFEILLMETDCFDGDGVRETVTYVIFSLQIW